MAVFVFIFVSLSLTAKLVPLAYGIQKLQISCVVEDDKVHSLIFLFQVCF